MLAVLGTLVHLVSVTVLPWVNQATGGQSLTGIWRDLVDSQARGFGDWYVLLFSYPLVVLGILLAFAAVLESAAMKVVWGGLMLLGLGYLLLRYGVGPLTGLFGSSEPMQFTTTDIVMAAVALAAAVIVAFVLKMAASTFRRVAGLILIGLAGLHITAIMDLDQVADVSELNVGAFGPSLGYLLIGVAALIGPRRLIPGL
jgi:hypothetical protein